MGDWRYNASEPDKASFLAAERTAGARLPMTASEELLCQLHRSQTQTGG
jgi:hypothetical protein